MLKDRKICRQVFSVIYSFDYIEDKWMKTKKPRETEKEKKERKLINTKMYIPHSHLTDVIDHLSSKIYIYIYIRNDMIDETI